MLSEATNPRELNETTVTLRWGVDTYSGEGVVQVVNGPRYDYNVVNVKPEGQDGCCKAHTYHTDMN